MKVVFLHQIILEARSIVVERVDDEKLVGHALETLEPAQPRPTRSISTFRPFARQVAPDRDV